MRIRAVLCMPALLIAGLTLTTAAQADTVKGRIQEISTKGTTIQIEVDGKPFVVLYGPQTQYVNATGIKDLGAPDLIEVEHTPGQPASKVTKVVFNLPPGAEIGIPELEAILAGKAPYVLVDARPAEQYREGHVPTSINIFAKELPANLGRLPADKGTLIVFYCGGPTCPYTGQSIETASAAGYTNLKGFQVGIPAWKKVGKPVVSTPEWVAASLDPHHVVIDVRPKAEVARGHIKGAVSLEAAELPKMTAAFIAEKKVAKLPGVTDMAAPIIVYGDSDSGQDVLTAYGELKKYQYKNVSILRGGFGEWTRLGLPTETGAAATQISYVKKLKEGAIASEEFAKLVANRGDTVLLDVREDKETAAGMLPGALHIGIDALQADPSKLPKGKPIVAYCSNGIRSHMAYQFLKKNGFGDVRFLNDSLTVKADGSYLFE
jgi:rhodanese-related sulfurtransferase